MTIRIIRASEPITVSHLVTTIYSAPGVGKTTLGFTAHDPILIDFDEGAYRSGNRGDSVVARTWGDAAGLAASDLAPYRTVVVDTVGRALDKLASDIIEREPKSGRGGALTLQGYGKLKAEFIAWLKMLRGFGLDIVLLAHMDEQKNGDEVTERIDAQGASKNEVYKVSDAMARLTLKNGKRVLLFSPSDTSFGKNPAGFPVLEVPPFLTSRHFLGDQIEAIKAKLNTLSADQQEVATMLATWAAAVENATTAKKMSALMQDIDSLDKRIHESAKKVLWNSAKSHGMTFDKASGTFTEVTVTPELEAVTA